MEVDGLVAHNTKTTSFAGYQQDANDSGISIDRMYEEEEEENDRSDSACDRLSGLDDATLLHIAFFLDYKAICRWRQTSKRFTTLLRDTTMWRKMHQQSFGKAHMLPQVPDDKAGPSKWELLYQKNCKVASIKTLYARREDCSMNVLELHAGASVKGTPYIFGGWSPIGILNDTYRLVRDEEGTTRWEQVFQENQIPWARYAHSMVACGRNLDQLLVAGGLTMGGYRGEIAEPFIGTIVEHPHKAPTIVWDKFDVVEGSEEFLERGFVSLAPSEDGTKVYAFGGMRGECCCDDLQVFHVEDRFVETIATTGNAPHERFGHSSVVYNGHLWVFGGGFGSDMLRDGYDFHDVHRLNLETGVWQQITQSGAPGRVHSGILIGNKWLMFGGGLQLSNEFVWFDLVTEEFGKPSHFYGSTPRDRMGTSLSYFEDGLVIYGGWHHVYRILGDTISISLHPSDYDMEASDEMGDVLQQGRCLGALQSIMGLFS